MSFIYPHFARATLVACLLCLFVGCGEEDRPPKRFVLYQPPEIVNDMGDMMATDGAEDMITTGACGTSIEGSRCALVNGTGICARGKCQLLACYIGFRDCDDSSINGCEQDVTKVTSCGTCTRTCRTQETCQNGERGYVCSAGVVCPSNKFDVDQDKSNGCEWTMGTREAVPVQPGSTFSVIQGVLLSSDAFVLAGRDIQDRFISTHWSDIGQLTPLLDDDAMALPATSSTAMAFGQFENMTLSGVVGWDNGEVTMATILGMVSDRKTLSPPCVLDTLDPKIVAAASSDEGQRAAVIHGRSVVSLPVNPLCNVTDSCNDERIVFGQADYLRAFYPYENDSLLIEANAVAQRAWRFVSSEVTSCTQCALNTTTGAFTDDRRCLDEGQCRDAAFDAQSVCTTCTTAPQQCPVFEPVDIQMNVFPDHHLVFTRRGLVLLRQQDQALLPVARFEVPFDPTQIQTQGIKAGTSTIVDGKLRIAYLHSAGYLRTIELEDVNGVLRFVPLGPDVGVKLDVNAASNELVFGPQDTLAVSDGINVFVLGLSERSAKMFHVESSEANEYSILNILAVEDGFLILREEFNQISVRHLNVTMP